MQKNILKMYPINKTGTHREIVCVPGTHPMKKPDHLENKWFGFFCSLLFSIHMELI